MTKHLFIINPAAGSHSTQHVEDTIRAHMSGDYTVARTEYPGHATALAAALDGADWRVYACGGDGTLNEVVCGAAGKPNVAITHYPCGTGNDFIKTVGDPGAFRDLPRLINGRERLIDCIDMGRGRFAVNICSMGVDADVAAEMSRFKWAQFAGSKMPYNLSVLYNVARGISRTYEVEFGRSRGRGVT